MNPCGIYKMASVGTKTSKGTECAACGMPGAQQQCPAPCGVPYCSARCQVSHSFLLSLPGINQLCPENQLEGTQSNLCGKSCQD